MLTDEMCKLIADDIELAEMRARLQTYHEFANMLKTRGHDVSALQVQAEVLDWKERQSRV